MNKEKFIKLVQENPDLPIKVFISGKCYYGENCWFVGEIVDCAVSKVVSYEPLFSEARYYKKEDIEEIIDDIIDRLFDDEQYRDLEIAEIVAIATEKAHNELDWLKCILLYVDV